MTPAPNSIPAHLEAAHEHLSAVMALAGGPYDEVSSWAGQALATVERALRALGYPPVDVDEFPLCEVPY